MGLVPCHIGVLLMGKCLLRRASSLWQGSLFAPGIVSLCDTGLFRAFNRQRGGKQSQKPQAETGVGTKTYHPSQSEGSISRWFHPGDS